MLGTIPQPTKRRVRVIAPFAPLPWQIKPWQDRSGAVLLTGSAGGGKSRLAAEKLHGFCLKYPGAMALMVRKTRESMTNSTVLFVERTVIGNDPHIKHNQSKHRFEYPNGSILAYGGMKDREQREQVRSIGQDGGVDMIWMEEAVAFDQEDYNELLARRRAKAAPWRQIVLTTNPDAPTHWIYTRLIQGGEAVVYYSSASENPHNPDEYVGTLASLTGVEGERLSGGKWVQATGVVYDVWSDGPTDGNVTEAAEYEADAGPVIWACDDGYSGERDTTTGQFTATSHPRVILLCQLKPDGHLDVFSELYAIRTLSDDQISEALALPYPSPDYAAHGPGAGEFRGRLHAAEIAARFCSALVDESIKETHRMLAADANGYRRIRVHPRCKHLRAEMASYRRDPQTEKPVKAFDHGPDALRYLAWIVRHRLG